MTDSDVFVTLVGVVIKTYKKYLITPDRLTTVALIINIYIKSETPFINISIFRLNASIF